MSTTDDTTPTDTTATGNTPAEGAAPTSTPRRRRAASRPAGPPADLPDTPADTGQQASSETAQSTEPAATTEPAVRTPRKRAAKKAPAATITTAITDQPDEAPEAAAPRSRRTPARTAAPDTNAPDTVTPDTPDADTTAAAGDTAPTATSSRRRKMSAPTFSAPEAREPDRPADGSRPGMLMFQAPPAEVAASPRRRTRAVTPEVSAEPELDLVLVEDLAGDDLVDDALDEDALDGDVEVIVLDDEDLEDDGSVPDGTADSDAPRRRRRRGGRGRRRRGAEDDAVEETGEREPTGDAEGDVEAQAEDAGQDDEDDAAGSSSRRRRRRRRGAGGGEDGRGSEDPPGTVTRVREPRARKSDEITAIKGSTRLEAKKQRRRDGREAGRRRPSILTEAEFLARREAVERVMVVRELTDRTQIAVLEDGVLVEHYVNRSSGASMIGNVYLGKVQNVLPSMEAAFVDIGRGRNAVLYAGEVNWDAAGLDGQPRRIEAALKSGDAVLVQVSKDPIGHKGARLTSQISLPGRFLVYVPEGQMTGISRKLPDTERTRLKNILRDVVPQDAGVIVRTAAEGASEEDLTRDVTRLAAQWEEIATKARASASSAPTLLYGEPDLAIKVVRDIFNEDFTKLVVSGDESWNTLQEYVTGVAPDLQDRLEKWTSNEDPFRTYRVDEQLTKALDRKVWLPSGGSLVIDRTEAMTVVDVNTGKFTGSGGNLEETVTRNNIEAAEEVVRQLRLRDIGGIIVVDFIDMVLESNRDLVLRRLLECLGRDRTKHQVAEVTSLGLVQMTRKRIGQGLLEVFSEPCDHCNGRGVIVYGEPVEGKEPRTEPHVVRTGAASAAAKIAAAGKRTATRSENEDSDATIPATGESTGDATGSDAAEATVEGGTRSGKSKRKRSGKGRREPSAATTDSDAPGADAQGATDEPTRSGEPSGGGDAAGGDFPAGDSLAGDSLAGDSVASDSAGAPTTGRARRPRGSRRATRSAGPATVDVGAPASSA